MPKRYRRTTIALMERRDVPLHEFPRGEGPPIFVTAKHGVWQRLGFGQGQLVPFTGELGGAYAFGLIRSMVVIWIHVPPGRPGTAYCYHAPLGPLDGRIHAQAVSAIECGQHCEDHLYVVLASARDVTQEEEGYFLQRGVHPEKVITYSNCLIPQFGIGHSGFFGEAS